MKKKQKSRQRKWQIKKESQGKCRLCGKKGVPSRSGRPSQHCQSHLNKKRAYSLKYYYLKKYL